MTSEAIAKRSNKRIQQELAPQSEKARKQKNTSIQEDKQNERSESDHAVYRGRGRGKRSEHSQNPTQPSPPNTTPPPVSTQPVSPPTPVAPPSEARSLAERYVSQYEEQSGHQLSSDERTAKVKEVETFYESRTRTGRLEKVVFA